MDLSRQSLETWLRTEDPIALNRLYREADVVRRAHVGDAVHLRGLVEISNHCMRRCGYCGLNVSNRSLSRYRMNADEIFTCALKAWELGYGTVVLQSGEDYGITQEWMVALIGRIKKETPLAVTLSLGERPYEDLLAWKQAGADRYLLRLETSNDELYRKIHPSLPGRPSDRMRILRELSDLGYEVGSGVMIGIPGQSYSSLAEDIDIFRRLDLDMIGVGPYIRHPDTDLVMRPEIPAIDPQDQVPNSETMTYEVIALTRLACPDANIPSTTALATLNKSSGRELGLQRGANVVMPNLTPPQYRASYEIYPNKACLFEAAEDGGASLRNRISAIGREVGVGPGGRKARGMRN
jgi:biotin synthase